MKNEQHGASDDCTGHEARSPRTSEEAPRPAELRPENVLSLRLGHGANCSSVGSVIDTLFLGAAVGGAIFAAVCAALRDEPVRVVGDEAGEKDAAAEEPTS